MVSLSFKYELQIIWNLYNSLHSSYTWNGKTTH